MTSATAEVTVNDSEAPTVVCPPDPWIVRCNGPDGFTYVPSSPKIGDFSVDEPTQYPDEGATSYVAIHRDFIDPIARSQALSLRIATAIANEFGAHG